MSRCTRQDLHKDFAEILKSTRKVTNMETEEELSSIFTEEFVTELQRIIKNDQGMVEALITIDDLEKKIADKVLEEGKMNLVSYNIRLIAAKETEKKEEDSMMEQKCKELSNSDND